MCWINFFESLQDVSISFKVHSAFHHLIHVSFFKSDVIGEIDELNFYDSLKKKRDLCQASIHVSTDSFRSQYQTVWQEKVRNKKQTLFSNACLSYVSWEPFSNVCAVLDSSVWTARTKAKKRFFYQVKTQPTNRAWRMKCKTEITLCRNDSFYHYVN